jgi:hypothetical protein
MPGPFTVVSVLRMAQEAAEAEPIKYRRDHTRAIVGEAIKRLRQEAAFGTYAEETVRALKPRGHFRCSHSVRLQRHLCRPDTPADMRALGPGCENGGASMIPLMILRR